ncbi:DUF2073 domain-containing protein [Candidatus Woesearchaeota archaeon]|nr:DUF2073 domain-containing protein [Candidatus Woesearchaeota archaeon]
MLTLQFVPFEEVNSLGSEEKIEKLLKIVRQNKVVLMQGRLKPMEETRLIQKTMENIHKGFRGVELCTIFPESKDQQIFNKLRKNLVNLLVGYAQGLTIIGPATVIKEIKRNPDKIELLTRK